MIRIRIEQTNSLKQIRPEKFIYLKNLLKIKTTTLYNYILKKFQVFQNKEKKVVDSLTIFKLSLSKYTYYLII